MAENTEAIVSDDALRNLIEGKSDASDSPAVAALRCMWDRIASKKKERAGLVSSAWTPTAIQLQSWSVFLNTDRDDGNRNIIAIAPTGSGKTLAYGMGVLAASQQLSKKSTNVNGICAICLVPTRELACQVQKNLKIVATPINAKIACIYGGQDRDDQISSLKMIAKQSNVLVVATPGRLVDLLEDRSDLRKLCGSIKFLVLDEADCLAKNKDSCEEIERIRRHLPDGIRTCLFSATMPRSVSRRWDEWVGEQRVFIEVSDTSDGKSSGGSEVVDSKVRKGGDNDGDGPVVSKKRKVDSGGQQTIPPHVTQTIRMCNCAEDKNRELVSTIKTIRRTQAKRNPGLTIVFFARIKVLQKVLKIICKSVPGCTEYHGKMSQSKRERALTDFRSGKSTVMLATDIAARGIHVKNLEYVVNYDFPEVLEQYVHRCGRAGRMQKDGTRAKGTVFSFITKEELAPEMARRVVDLLRSAKSPADPKLLECLGG